MNCEYVSFVPSLPRRTNLGLPLLKAEEAVEVVVLSLLLVVVLFVLLLLLLLLFLQLLLLLLSLLLLLTDIDALVLFLGLCCGCH